MRLWLFALFLLMSLRPAAAQEEAETACSTARWGPPLCIRATHFVQDTCAAIEGFAMRHGLDPHFFARLIWQESRFDPNALSPVGAQGIAQFMPHTARRRGLADSYNPADALDHSALYLSEMASEYGNIGLAAIGYNGGERRAERLIAGTGGLAQETVDYVAIITGVPHRNWLETPAPTPDLRLAPDRTFTTACRHLAKDRRISPLRPAAPIIQPWGIQLAFGTTKEAAKARFDEKTRACSAMIGDQVPDFVFEKSRASAKGGYHFARLGRDTRDAAWRDCSRMKRAGCICAVYRND